MKRIEENKSKEIVLALLLFVSFFFAVEKSSIDAC